MSILKFHERRAYFGGGMLRYWKIANIINMLMNEGWGCWQIKPWFCYFQWNYFQNKTSLTILTFPIKIVTFLVSNPLVKKWELTDITQFLAESVAFGRISNILEEIDFWPNFKVERYIDVKHNSASFKTNFAVEVRKTHCHAGLDRELNASKRSLMSLGASKHNPGTLDVSKHSPMTVCG